MTPPRRPHEVRHPAIRRIAPWLLPALLACSGDIGGGDNSAGGPNDTPGAGDNAGPGGDDGAGPGSTTPGDGDTGDDPAAADNPHGEDLGDLPDGVPLGTRLVRLTHAQYDNTVRDLLGLDADKSAAFLGDPTFAGYDNNAEALAVTGRLGRDYRRAAEELSVAVLADSGAYGRVVPCESADMACARQFIEEFGARAFRRPLSDDQIDLYLTLHARGAELVGSGDAFRDGVQLTLEAMLQSPNFLYRVELSREENDEGLIPLDGYEIASRLSYMLWNSMPDDALFDAAAAGDLDDATGIAGQATRLLDDDRARGVVADFHHQWLDLDHFRDLTKSETLYPEFQSDLSDALQEETQRFIEHVVFELEGGLTPLLREPSTFVNQDLAPLYGLDGSAYGPDFVRVDLDAQTRGGVLTQIGFLASHAYTTNTSPIHRGVFVLRQILCYPLPDPPGDVDLTLPPIEGAIRTTRQQVEVHTSPDSCQGCHGIINPVGYAFEQFDSIGRHRTEENGEPLDTSGAVRLDGAETSYQDSTEMLDAIAASEDARDCYARNWLRYAYGRDDREADTSTLSEITGALADSDYSVKSMLAALTQSRSFRFRAPNTVYQP